MVFFLFRFCNKVLQKNFIFPLKQNYNNIRDTIYNNNETDDYNK